MTCYLVTLAYNILSLPFIPPYHAGLISASNALSWMLDHTSWSSSSSENRLAVVVAPLANPPHRRHRTSNVHTDVVSLLHLLPSLLLPPTPPTGTSPGSPCESFRQAAETYRLALQGVGEGRWNTVAEVLQGLSEAPTTTATTTTATSAVSADSESPAPRYCRLDVERLPALEKAVGDARRSQGAATTADAVHR